MTRNLLKLLTAFALSGVAAISMAADPNFVVDELRAVHSQLTDTRRWVDSDIGANLSHRWKSAPRRLADSGLRFAESELEGLPWVTDVDLHRITRNGNFLAGVGVSGVGLLWTGESHALGFQPSGEWIEGEGDDFASFGVFGRKAVGDWGVIGANVFGDYASDSELGEFSRWSLGADFQSELADLRGNWYAEGTGVRSQRIRHGQVYAYSPSGIDAELNLRWRGVAEWTGFAEYEKWDGRFGDADTQDVGFGFTYRPLGGGLLAGLEVDAGYFTALGGTDDRLDFRLAYSRTLGGDNRATERNFGFGIQSALIAPVARKRKIEIAEATILDPEFFDAESRIYRQRDGVFITDQRPFMMEVKSRCTLFFEWPQTTYEQKTSAELHEQAENPAQFDDLCDTINKTANIRTLDSNGNLATHRAVSGGALDNLKILIAAGVRVTATNTAGKTPLDLAQQKHKATGDSALRETLSTIAMVVRASGGECARESGTLCTIEYDALYGDDGYLDFSIYDSVVIPSNFKGISVYQLHHPEYGKMTVSVNISRHSNSRTTVTADGEVRIVKGAVLKAYGFNSEHLIASNEHLPYPAHVHLDISVSVVSHPQPWTIPPIRKVAPNYTGAYFTVTAVPPAAQLAYSFGPKEKAVYRLFSYSGSRISGVTDGEGGFSHADHVFVNDLQSYNHRDALLSGNADAIPWRRSVDNLATADGRLAATYDDGVFAVSLNQAIGQNEAEVRAVHMVLDPYDYAQELQTLAFTIAVPSIPSRAVYTVEANETGLVDTLVDDDLRNVAYEVIDGDAKLSLNSSGQLRVVTAISIGKSATVTAQLTSPDLLGTLTITVEVLSKCATGTINQLPRNHRNYHTKGKSLQLAAQGNNLDSLCRLIKEGADPNYGQHNDLRRPLDYGAREADVEIAQALHLHGAKVVYRQNGGLTPLMAAARGVNYDYAEFLMRNGARATVRANSRDQAIHLVGAHFGITEDDYLKFYQLLLNDRGNNSANINERGIHGRTPLMRAAITGRYDQVKVVLDLGGNKNDVDLYGDNACSFVPSGSRLNGLLGC